MENVISESISLTEDKYKSKIEKVDMIDPNIKLM